MGLVEAVALAYALLLLLAGLLVASMCRIARLSARPEARRVVLLWGSAGPATLSEPCGERAAGAFSVGAA